MSTAMSRAFEAASARTAQQSDPEAELQLDDDRWAEAHMRASAFTSVTSDDYPIISRGIYKQLCEENWHAA